MNDMNKKWLVPSMNNMKPNLNGYYDPKDIETNDVQELKAMICTLRRLLDNQDENLTKYPKAPDIVESPSECEFLPAEIVSDPSE